MASFNWSAPRNADSQHSRRARTDRSTQLGVRGEYLPRTQIKYRTTAHLTDHKSEITCPCTTTCSGCLHSLFGRPFYQCDKRTRRRDRGPRLGVISSDIYQYWPFKYSRRECRWVHELQAEGQVADGGQQDRIFSRSVN